MEICRPDLKSPCCALSAETIFSKTLPLKLSIHGGQSKIKQKEVCILARKGPLDASRPDLESPFRALSIGAVISKTLPLHSSIHGGHFGKKGQKSVRNTMEK